MRFRVPLTRGISRFTSTHATTGPSLAQRIGQSQLRPNPAIHYTFPAPRFISSEAHRAREEYHSRSDTVIKTAGAVFGVAIGGAILLTTLQDVFGDDTAEEINQESSHHDFKFSDLTESHLKMAPNTPPGRPGTLTPEQEVKLRALWAQTMKVFGVYEPPPSETNGAAVTPATPSETSESTATGTKEKKKSSRLNVFKRHKNKDTDSETPSTSGYSTPTDLSQLSLSEEDDKHGQTKDFKTALANSAPEDLRKTFWSMVKHDHPDGLLLRFLRARKWDVDKALIMLISTMHWRAEEMHVDDDIMRRGEAGMLEDSKSSDPDTKKNGEDFLTQMRMGKSYMHGVDKEGRPMCFVRVRLHRAGEQTQKSLERYTVYTIENARMLLRPPVDTATVVFDMTDFSMANMDYTPVKFMIKCFEANYPESLGTVLIYKSPWIFQGIWSMIRGWLDPVVAGKVHFTRNIDELETYIARNQIPKELGGDEDWEYSYVEPDPSENTKLSDHTARDPLLARQSELVRQYESTVLEWIHSGEKTDAAAGSKSLDERREERNKVAEALRQNYWELDPYLRARSWYDRIGVLGEGGKLTVYPDKKALEQAKSPFAAVARSAAVPQTSEADLD